MSLNYFIIPEDVPPPGTFLPVLPSKYGPGMNVYIYMIWKIMREKQIINKILYKLNCNSLS